MKSMKALQQLNNALVCFIEYFTLHRNSSLGYKVNGPETTVIVFLAMIKVIAMQFAEFFIAKSLNLEHRYIISIICMLLLACKIF